LSVYETNNRNSYIGEEKGSGVKGRGKKERDGRQGSKDDGHPIFRTLVHPLAEQPKLPLPAVDWAVAIRRLVAE